MGLLAVLVRGLGVLLGQDEVAVVAHDVFDVGASERAVVHDELELALDELPHDQPMSQREVFIAHELEGRSFKELSAESGVNVNTLLSRKRYAVLHLRRRLQSIYDEYKEK